MTDSKERFSDHAQAYAAHRPGYPPEAIDCALERLGELRTLIVADIGAGTGISSRLFAERGARVIAIEPNAEMRAAARSHPSIEWRNGTAQATGLESGSVDLVVACQAFHWFADDGAVHEMRRIACRRAAVLQYERDARDAFTAAYGEIVHRYEIDDTEALRLRALTVFAGFPNARVTRHEFLYGQQLDREALFGRIASTSYLPQRGATADAMRAEVGALVDRFAVDGTVAMAMRAIVLRADW